MTSVTIDWEEARDNFNLDCPNTEHHERYGIEWETPYESTTDRNGDPCEEYEGCPVCEDDCGQVIPMMNYGHIITYDGMITDAVRLKIAKETACVLVQNNKTDRWFIALMGGGMDLSPHIAYAYFLAQKWLPLDLLEELRAEWCKIELSKEKFEELRAVVKQQSMAAASAFTDTSRNWIDA